MAPWWITFIALLWGESNLLMFNVHLLHISPITIQSLWKLHLRAHFLIFTTEEYHGLILMFHVNNLVRESGISV